MDWFKGNFTGKLIFNGKTMVSGYDFPNKTNPLILHGNMMGYLGKAWKRGHQWTSCSTAPMYQNSTDMSTTVMFVGL